MTAIPQSRQANITNYMPLSSCAALPDRNAGIFIPFPWSVSVVNTVQGALSALRNGAEEVLLTTTLSNEPIVSAVRPLSSPTTGASWSSHASMRLHQIPSSGRGRLGEPDRCPPLSDETSSSTADPLLSVDKYFFVWAGTGGACSQRAMPGAMP